jgi:HEAT repeat protein
VAGELLKGVGRDGSGAVPALLDALKDSDKQVRLHAAQALAEIDPAAPMVLPAVVDTLRDVDPEVRKAAQAALVKAGKPAVRQLAVALRSSAADQRIALAEVLQQMGDKAKDAVPVFLELVKDPDRQVRFKAILALRDIAPVSPPAVQVFLEGLRDSDEEVRVAAHIALLQKPKEIVPHLAAALKHKEVDVRRGVVETIKKIATEGHAPEELRTAVPGLVLTLRDPDEEVRTGAEWTLAAIDPQLKAALPVLLRAVHNPPKVATGKPLPAGANLTYVPTPRLVGALVQEKGAQLAEVLTELQCRRGEPVLVGLALAATLDDATVQPRALAAFQAYLGAEPPGELEEKQAAAKLSLAKNLVESGRPALARERYQDLVRAHPATRAAEEARELLSR